MFRYGTVVLLLSTIGCGDTSPPPAPDIQGVRVDITTDARRYRNSDSVTVTVHNQTGSAIRIELCPAVLQHWTGTDWVPVKFWPGLGKATCAILGGDVAVGGSYSLRFALLDGVPPGEYRIEFPNLELGDQGPLDNRDSHVFSVER